MAQWGLVSWLLSHINLTQFSNLLWKRELDKEVLCKLNSYCWLDFCLLALSLVAFLMFREVVASIQREATMQMQSRPFSSDNGVILTCFFHQIFFIGSYSQLFFFSFLLWLKIHALYFGWFSPFGVIQSLCSKIKK